MNKIYAIEEIDVLVKKYKEKHDTEASLELYKAFEGYLIKYTYFIKYGSMKPTDKDLIGLCKILGITHNGTNTIVTLFDTWEFQDIFNELYLLFLKCVNQFVKRENGPSFVGYLYNYFKYTVKIWITEISQDVLNKFDILNIDDITEYEVPKNEPTEYDSICMTEKTSLTQEEKYILHLYYGKKMSLEEMAKLLGVCRSYLTAIRDTAKSKLIESGCLLEDLEKLDK